ncbi:MAG: DNA-3-methyladenine glycosylase [Planctomycetales bacterium]|nr:DNA-3-methyladenine glycosylase [Planctomycetales bacterium]
MALLTRDFYERDPLAVARELIGKHLVRRTSHGLCSGVIVETEAYLAADDPASHSYRGVTRKNATMFGRAGLLYVYPIHARHCLNAVTESRGIASAVLIRAVQPLQGIELMHQRRQCSPTDLVRGPARLCEAFAVDRRLDGWDLTRGTRIWIEQPDDSDVRDQQIVVSPRIGVTSGRNLELRFFLKDSPCVSGPRTRWRRRKRLDG